MKRITNLVGNRFGHWLVLSYAGKENTKHRWRCRCDCGIEIDVNGGNLTRGLTSCCCNCSNLAKRKEMIGKIFGKLKVTKYAYVKNQEPHWECQCSCGNIKITSGHSLRRGCTKSCGCLLGKHCIKHGLSKDRKKYIKYLMSSPFRRLRQRISISINKALRLNNSSKNKQSIWNYLPYTSLDLQKHLESLWEPWMNWNNYGGKPGDKRQTWWIDHIIPQDSFQYKSMNNPAFLECWNLSNLQPLEKIANIKKGAKCLNVA